MCSIDFVSQSLLAVLAEQNGTTDLAYRVLAGLDFIAQCLKSRTKMTANRVASEVQRGS